MLARRIAAATIGVLALSRRAIARKAKALRAVVTRRRAHRHVTRTAP